MTRGLGPGWGAGRADQIKEAGAAVGGRLSPCRAAVGPVSALGDWGGWVAASPWQLAEVYPGSSGHRSAFGNTPPSGAGQRKTLPGHCWDDGAPGMPRSGGPMASGARPLWLLALWTLAGAARSGAAEAGDGGW